MKKPPFMLLELLHLADSALPTGAMAHSFGLETLAEEGSIGPETAWQFLHDYLAEGGVLEASVVRRAWRGEDAFSLNDEFGARRVAMESRDASLKLGRRFADLFNTLLREPAIPAGLYYPVAFGIAGAALDIPETNTALAYLRQSVAGLVSACQRLMPMGQVAANSIIWNLRSSISAAAQGSEMKEVSCVTPLLELASMRHGSLETRLFIS